MVQYTINDRKKERCQKVQESMTRGICRKEQTRVSADLRSEKNEELIKQTTVTIL